MDRTWRAETPTGKAGRSAGGRLNQRVRPGQNSWLSVHFSTVKMVLTFFQVSNCFSQLELGGISGKKELNKDQILITPNSYYALLLHTWVLITLKWSIIHMPVTSKSQTGSQSMQRSQSQRMRITKIFRMPSFPESHLPPMKIGAALPTEEV